LLITRDDADVGARVGEGARGCAPDAGGAAGDDDGAQVA